MDLYYDVYVKAKNGMGKHKLIFLVILECILIVWQCVQINQIPKVQMLFQPEDFYGWNGEEDFYTNQLYADHENMNSLRTRGISLPQGIYQVQVQYETSESGSLNMEYTGRGADDTWLITQSLPREQQEKTFEFWVNQKRVEEVRPNLSSSADFTVKAVQITTAYNSKIYLLVCFFLKLLLVDLLIAAYCYRDKLSSYAGRITGILLIGFICSIGLTTRYMLNGHDIFFHLNRIEGLKEGLLSGQFPVRIQPFWNNDWGYAVSQMYGELLLIFPALLRMSGFTLQTSWKAFVIAVNILTAATSYYAFHEISRDKYKALFASLLYCTAPYRLACIYIRAAAGEFSVLAFLPLAVLSFWYAVEEDTDSADYGKKIIAPVIGFTGMLQTHILTCEMSLLFIILFCILFYKKVFVKKPLFYLLKIASFTLLINLWFLVPFLRLMQEDLKITEMSEMRDDFQSWGLSLAELFSPSASRYINFSFGENVSLNDKCTYTIGLALWAGLTLALLLILKKKTSKQKGIVVMGFFGLLSAFMVTRYFPYLWLKDHCKAITTLLSKIQFSYRFLTMVILFFSLTALLALMYLKDKKVQSYLGTVMIAVSILAIYQGIDFQFETLYSGNKYIAYGASDLDSTWVMTGEYLYQNSVTDITRNENDPIVYQASISSYEKNGLDIKATVKATGEDAYMELPIFGYPGYVAYNEQGKAFKLSRSDNNARIRVDLSGEDYETIHVYFKEPVYYRVCEVISAVAFLVLLFQKKLQKLGEYLWTKRKKKPSN